MNSLKEFNDSIEALGKELFRDEYRFSSTSVDTIMHGESLNYKRITEYRGIIFYGNQNSNKSIMGKSVDIQQVGEILTIEYAKLVATPSCDIDVSIL